MALPQSGRSSAVGFIPETAFSNVPLTNISGNNYYPGIPATNPNRFFIAEPGGGYDVKPQKDVGVDEQDGDNNIHRVTLTGKTYTGKDTFKIDPENLYFPALGITGRDIQTQLAVGAYKHVHYYSKYVPSFTQEEQFGDGTSGRLSAGVVFDALRITHGNILTAQVDYHAHRQIPNRYPAAALVDTDYDFVSAGGLLPSQLGGDHTKRVKLTVTPTYVDVAQSNCGNGPLVWANATYGTAAGFSSCYITLNDSPYQAQIMPGWSVDIVRDIESHMVAGSGFDPSAPVANVFNVSGKLQILFADNTIPANTLANCKFGLNMLFRGAQIASTGYYYTYEIYLPNLKFMDADMTRQSKSLMTGGSFQAIEDPSLGYECMITLQNSFTNAALAGGYPALGQGLGGFKTDNS